MSITLNWGNYNLPEQFSRTEIYRSTDKSSVYEPENLLASITDKAQSSYVDETAVRETKYFYGVSVSSEIGLVRTPPILAVFTAFEGIGGSKVICGNQEFGAIKTSSYREIYDIASVVTTSILTSMGVTPVTFNYTAVDAINNGIPLMHKLWYNGDIVYVPNSYDFYASNGSGPVTLQRLRDFMAMKNRTFELNGQMYEIEIMDKNMFLDVVVAGLRDQRVIPNRCIPRTVAGAATVSSQAISAVVLPKEGDNVVYVYCNTGMDRFLTIDSSTISTLSASFIGWYVKPLKT